MNELPSHVSSALGLVKRNGGVFKSTKQSAFLRKMFASNSEFEPRFAGIDDAGHTFTFTDYVRWADYGSNSLRPYGWIFEYDEYGITRQWKLAWQGNMRDGTAINPNRTKLVFERAADADVSHLVFEAEEEKAVEPGEYIAPIGTRVETDLTVTSLFETEGYYGTTTIVGFEDEAGNSLVWFASGFPNVERGSKYHLRGTVKAHKEYRGRNQTVLTRCKVAA